MNEQQIVRTSKYLALVLRHRPQMLGLTLAPGGWVAIDDLLAASARNGRPISRAELEEVVARNDKQRFGFDEAGERIRANQGHSTPVDLQLEEAEPPTTLYHGTGTNAVPSIEREGLRKMRRHHVHLSADPETARTVGQRHGMPTVFAVDAAAMRRDGIPFYHSENNVWLVDAVPARYLTRLAGSGA